MIKQKLTASLRVKFLAVMFAALSVGVLTFILVHFAANYTINNQYMSDDSVDARERGYIDNLQKYITQNELSSNDTADITKWVKNQRYVYLVIYKDTELIYDSIKAEEEEEAAKDKVNDKDDDDPDTQSEASSGSDFWGSLSDKTDDDISRYLDADATLFPIKLSDGIMFASIAEFTQELYYNLSYIISIMAAFILFAIIMMLYFNKTTLRIEKLAGNVRKIEQNNELPDLVIDGSDEIGELANDVNKMKNSIFEKMQKEQDAWKANTELITAMSHDIRNPLTVLLGYLDVMEMQKDTAPALKGYIDACRETALKIKNLSDDMFQYFLVFGKKDIDMSMQDYDAQTLLNQVVSEHMLLMTENGYKFITEPLEKECTISIDAAAFVRVIDNLFSNLKKYADIAQPIYIKASADDNNVILIMQNSTIQNDVESNGIGLKTCSKIMDAMNAGFEASSDDTTFTVKLTISIKKD